MCGWGSEVRQPGLPIAYNVIQKNMPGGLPARAQGKIPREEVRIVQQIVFGGAEA